MAIEMIKQQIDRIREKIILLVTLDKHLELFGADNHQYKFGPSATSRDIFNFENRHKIKLPEAYVAFITEIGNGGMGPFYGTEPLKNALFADLDNKEVSFAVNLSEPFPHSASWNIEFFPATDVDLEAEKYFFEKDKFDTQYFSLSQISGAISTCNYGCGVRIMLVVNGEEYGRVWTDDRVNGNGIFPSKELGNSDPISFLDWYELWLDNSIAALQQ